MATKAKTTRKARRSKKDSDRSQFERFREFAREHGADEDPETFDRMAKKIIRPSSSPGER